MVVMGNPPYSYDSQNKGKWIKSLVQDYYQVDGQPLKERNPRGLQDDYVKFIRFAQWRIVQTGYGIFAFITNHRYLSNPTFMGMRQSLIQSFDEIYILNLHGSTKPKENPPLGELDQNVFDIQQGVAIGIFVKHTNKKKRDCKISYADLWGKRDFKYGWLMDYDLSSTDWLELNPQSPFYYFVPQNRNGAEEYESGYKITEVMPINSVGLYTARDDFSIRWKWEEILTVLKDFISLPAEVAREKYSLGKDSRDWQVTLAQKDVSISKLDTSKFQQITYRPFDTRYTYYTGVSRGLICMPRSEVMQHMINRKNLAICFMRNSREQVASNFFVANHIVDKTILSSADNANVAPLYIFSTTETQDALFHNEPHPNFSQHFIDDFTKKLTMQFIQDGTGDLHQTFGPEDIFTYMYAIFHAPAYRERYAEFLKIDFPRLPLTSNAELFRELCKLGNRLVKLHLMEGEGEELASYPQKGNNVVDVVKYTEPGQGWDRGRVWINKEQYFEGVALAVWEFHVGGYQVCQKWLKDRKGRVLSYEDIEHYARIVANLAETIGLMQEIDAVIDEHGGWPIV